MRIYLADTVYEMSVKRIEHLFDRFDEVAVWFSGGKDSTVCLNLVLEIAERRGQLPVRVLWIDQEAEWQCTVDYVKSVMEDERVEPHWYQVPMRLFNATSTTSDDVWLNCWGEGEEWMRPQDDLSIKVNDYGVDRFGALFNAISRKDFPEKTAFVGGVRCEESPARAMAITAKGKAMFDWMTYGKALNPDKDQYTFYPIYDWSYTDVWKAIHDNDWTYNKLYDYQYQYGVNVKDMRCSNVHHETAVTVLYYLQEIEGDTWAKLCQRLEGINTAGHLQESAFMVKDLPSMFEDWEEYREHLFKNMISEERAIKRFTSYFDRGDIRYGINPILHRDFCKACVRGILRNDYESTVIGNFEKMAQVGSYVRWRRMGPVVSPHVFFKINPYYCYDKKRGLVSEDGMETTHPIIVEKGKD